MSHRTRLVVALHHHTGERLGPRVRNGSGAGPPAVLSKAFQPQSPQPKLAVKRMQKATTPINHMSSDFIVRVLLS
jgi:hypothetical protein